MRVHRFSWINEWKEYIRPGGRSDGIGLVLADWFFLGAMEEALVLTLDRTYFRLSGGASSAGWRFQIRYLHLKSGALQRYRDFAAQVRSLAWRQALPGYGLFIERSGGNEWPAFRHCADSAVAKYCLLARYRR